MDRIENLELRVLRLEERFDSLLRTIKKLSYGALIILSANFCSSWFQYFK